MSRVGVAANGRPAAGAGGLVVQVSGLTKRFAGVLAVDDVSFTVRPGRVTGFLGPNGAGKSTTVRLVLGLDRPTSGAATIGGLRYGQWPRPMLVAGALLEARSFHPGRSAADHLSCLAQTQGLPRRRVGEVLELVGLTAVAGRRAGRLSLGMGHESGHGNLLVGGQVISLPADS